MRNGSSHLWTAEAQPPHYTGTIHLKAEGRYIIAGVHKDLGTLDKAGEFSMQVILMVTDLRWHHRHTIYQLST